MDTPKINIDKVRVLSSYLAEKVDDLYVTKFYKLLYYIDFIAYAKRESPVTGDVYYKLPYGPVPTLIKNEVDNLISEDPEIVSQLSKSIKLVSVDGDGKRHIIKNTAKSIDTDALSPFEHEIVEGVLKKFTRTSSGALSSRTHNELPYKLTSRNSAISYDFAMKLDIDSILS